MRKHLTSSCNSNGIVILWGPPEYKKTTATTKHKENFRVKRVKKNMHVNFIVIVLL